MKNMNFETYRRELGKVRHFYIENVIGGYRKDENDFFHNNKLLDKIYNLNKEFLKGQGSILDIKYLLRRINCDSEEDRLKSISLNLSLDLDKVKVKLPKDFSIRPSNNIHPENIHQLSILYNDSKNSFVKDLFVASLGFYLLEGKIKTN